MASSPRTHGCRGSWEKATVGYVARMLPCLLLCVLLSACGSRPGSARSSIESLSLSRVIRIAPTPTSVPVISTSPMTDPASTSAPVDPPASPTPANIPVEPDPPTPTVGPSLTPTEDPTATVAATATDMPTVTPSPSLPPSSQGRSLLEENTIVSYYGRCFSPDPGMDSVAILGQLALYDNFAQFYADIQEYSGLVDTHNGDRGVIPAMNIIYELATGSPDMGDGTYLLNVDAYLKAYDAGTLEEDYIKPALEKGVLVFLDNQLGLSSVYEQTQEMLHWLREYENVHFFFDAEFHIYPGQVESGEVSRPGSPHPGQIDAGDINAALRLIHDFTSENGISREIIVGLHQFQDVNVPADTRDMILYKNDIEIPPGISIVIDADGFSPAEASQRLKWTKYVGITDPDVYGIFSQGAYPAIKIFPPSAYISPTMYDYDVLTVRQLMGVDPTSSDDFFTRPPVMIIVN